MIEIPYCFTIWTVAVFRHIALVQIFIYLYVPQKFVSNIQTNERLISNTQLSLELVNFFIFINVNILF